MFVGFPFLPLLERLGHPSQPNRRDGGTSSLKLPCFDKPDCWTGRLAALSGGSLRSLIENPCYVANAGLKEALKILAAVCR